MNDSKAISKDAGKIPHGRYSLAVAGFVIGYYSHWTGSDLVIKWCQMLH